MKIPKIESLFLAMLAALILASPFQLCATQTQNVGDKPAWEVTLKTDSQATSNLEIENRCKNSHNFNVTKQDMAFLEYSLAAPVKVAGHQSFKLPVRFSTNGLTAGQYHGTVLVLCLDCRSEPTCTQDRETLPVVLNVIPEQGIVVRHGEVQSDPPSQPGDQEEYFLPSGAQRINRANALKWWGSPFPPPGVTWCCCCCEPVRTMGPANNNPSSTPSVPPISVSANLGIGKFGPGKGIHVLAAPGTPISGAKYLAEAYIQWNASGGKGQLTVDLEVQRPRSSSWEKLVSGRGPNDEHLFSADAPGSYVFRVTARDSAGNSSFNTLTVDFPCIGGLNCPSV